MTICVVFCTYVGNNPRSRLTSLAETNLKANLKGKRKFAAWDNDFMATPVAGMIAQRSDQRA